MGVSGSEASEALSRDPETLLGYSMVGCQRAMMANRLSFFFDFKGGYPQSLWASGFPRKAGQGQEVSVPDSQWRAPH